MYQPVNSISDNWNDNLQSFNQEKKMKHQYQSFTRIGRQFQSLKRQVYAVWTSVSFLLCQRSCLIWRIITNTMTNTYVVIFLLASFFGRSYHSRYRISSPLVSTKISLHIVTNVFHVTSCINNTACAFTWCEFKFRSSQQIFR